MAQRVDNRLVLMKVSAAAKLVAGGQKTKKTPRLLIAVICPIEYLSGDEWKRLTSRLQVYAVAKNAGTIRISFSGSGVLFYASRYMGDTELGKARALTYKEIDAMTPEELGRQIDFNLED